MKTAKASIAAVYLDCPNGCEDSIVDETGSLMLLPGDLPDRLYCMTCDEELRVPEWVFKHER